MSAPALAHVANEAPETCPGCGCRLDGHAAICPYCGREQAGPRVGPKLALTGRPSPSSPSFDTWIGRALPVSLALLIGFGLLSLMAVLYGRWAGPPAR